MVEIIPVNNFKKTKFSSLKVGDTFLYKNNLLCMKIHQVCYCTEMTYFPHSLHAIALENGKLVQFDDEDTIVYPVDIKVFYS